MLGDDAHRVRRARSGYRQQAHRLPGIDAEQAHHADPIRAPLFLRQHHFEQGRVGQPGRPSRAVTTRQCRNRPTSTPSRG